MKLIGNNNFDYFIEQLNMLQEDAAKELNFFALKMPEVKKQNKSGIPGIYMIRNKDTLQMYVGQAKDLQERLRKHISRCKAKKDATATHRDSPKLHNAIIAHGLDSFEAAIIEETADLDAREKH